MNIIRTDMNKTKFLVMILVVLFIFSFSKIVFADEGTTIEKFVIATYEDSLANRDVCPRLQISTDMSKCFEVDYSVQSHEFKTVKEVACDRVFFWNKNLQVWDVIIPRKCNFMPHGKTSDGTYQGGLALMTPGWVSTLPGGQPSEQREYLEERIYNPAELPFDENKLGHINSPYWITPISSVFKDSVILGDETTWRALMGKDGNTGFYSKTFLNRRPFDSLKPTNDDGYFGIYDFDYPKVYLLSFRGETNQRKLMFRHSINSNFGSWQASSYFKNYPMSNLVISGSSTSVSELKLPLNALGGLDMDPFGINTQLSAQNVRETLGSNFMIHGGSGDALEGFFDTNVPFSISQNICKDLFETKFSETISTQRTNIGACINHVNTPPYSDARGSVKPNVFVYGDKIWVTGGHHPQSSLVSSGVPNINKYSKKIDEVWTYDSLHDVSYEDIILLNPTTSFVVADLNIEGSSQRVIVAAGAVEELYEGYHEAYSNRMKYSKNGKDWETISSTGNIWEPRYGHFFFTTSPDVLWVMGGKDYLGNVFTDVWKSMNGGKTWVKQTNSVLPYYYESSQIILFKNHFYLMGGDVDDPATTSVWRSSGSEGFSIAPSPPWLPREDFATVVYQNKLWVFGGKNGNQYYNDVWSSTNGEDWTLENDNPGWSPRAGMSAVVYDNRIFLVGGYDSSTTYTPDIWYYVDAIIPCSPTPTYLEEWKGPLQDISEQTTCFVSGVGNTVLVPHTGTEYRAYAYCAKNRIVEHEFTRALLYEFHSLGGQTHWNCGLNFDSYYSSYSVSDQTNKEVDFRFFKHPGIINEGLTYSVSISEYLHEGSIDMSTDPDKLALEDIDIATGSPNIVFKLLFDKPNLRAVLLDHPYDYETLGFFRAPNHVLYDRCLDGETEWNCRIGSVTESPPNIWRTRTYSFDSKGDFIPGLRGVTEGGEDQILNIRIIPAVCDSYEKDDEDEICKMENTYKRETGAIAEYMEKSLNIIGYGLHFSEPLWINSAFCYNHLCQVCNSSYTPYIGYDIYNDNKLKDFTGWFCPQVVHGRVDETAINIVIKRGAVLKDLEGEDKPKVVFNYSDPYGLLESLYDEENRQEYEGIEEEDWLDLDGDNISPGRFSPLWGKDISFSTATPIKEDSGEIQPDWVVTQGTPSAGDNDRYVLTYNQIHHFDGVEPVHGTEHFYHFGFTREFQIIEFDCHDGIDNSGNGLIDYSDPACNPRCDIGIDGDNSVDWWDMAASMQCMDRLLTRLNDEGEALPDSYNFNHECYKIVTKEIKELDSGAVDGGVDGIDLLYAHLKSNHQEKIHHESIRSLWNEILENDYDELWDLVIKYNLLTDINPHTGAGTRSWRCWEFSCNDKRDERGTEFPFTLNDNDGRIDREDPDCRIVTDFSCLYTKGELNPFSAVEQEPMSSISSSGQLSVRISAFIESDTEEVEEEEGYWIPIKNIPLATEVVWEGVPDSCKDLPDGVEVINISSVSSSSSISPSSGPLPPPTPYQPPENALVENTDIELKSFSDIQGVTFLFYLRDVTDVTLGETLICETQGEDLIEGGSIGTCVVDELPRGKVYSWRVRIFGDVDGSHVFGGLSKDSVFRTKTSPMDVCYTQLGEQIPCSVYLTKKYKNINLVTLPLNFKYYIRDILSYLREGEELSELGCGLDRVSQYYTETDTFTPFTDKLPHPFGYHSVPIQPFDVSSDICIAWDNDRDGVIDDIVLFENRTLVSMNFTFSFTAIYELVEALYSNKDRVPMLVGGAI